MKRALRVLRRWRTPIFYALVIWTAVTRTHRYAVERLARKVRTLEEELRGYRIQEEDEG